MDANNNQNADWIELGGVTAIENIWYDPYRMYGKLYVRKVFDKLVYKFKDIDTNTEYVVVKNTDLKNCSKNAYVRLPKEGSVFDVKCYFDVPEW